MLRLKKYQDDALTTLREYLQQCQSKAPADAFAVTLATQGRSEPYQEAFEGVPTVCLRVPTGGGKTLLAAHAVAMAGQTVLGTDAPVALWLTPSDAIRTQTMKALSNARHPYRQALAKHYGERVQVCDLESLQTIGPQDVGRTCIIVVSTIQAFNVTHTATRNVYSFFEDLAPHFDGLPDHETEGLEKVTEADLEHQPYLTASDVGRVKYSVANWLHRQHPVVIVDEAHNNRTHRFFNSLGRMNPGCVIELTATPVPTNNVLYHVAASELKAEDMIKLPIVLVEHPTGWQGCLHDAHLTRKKLEDEAKGEADYVRPIMLIQAEPKNGTATVEVVKQYLLDELNIPEERIAVATGTQRELNGVDLFDPACQIRFVITVEALKEGWDCPFAYVLASLQSVRSATDVEQLLGRVLRMPYATARKQESLNKAYAHIVAANFAEAASTLKDRMVQNMGFERYEAAGVVVQPKQHEVELTGGGGAIQATPQLAPDCHIQLPSMPDTQFWPEEIKAKVDVRETSAGATVLIRGDATSEELEQAEQFVTESIQGHKKKEEVRAQFNDYRATRRAMVAPERIGVAFAPIAQLCLEIDGYLELVERETLTQLGDWDLNSQKVQLEGFSIHEEARAFEIRLREEQITYTATDTRQLHLNDVTSNVSEQDLVRWLDRETRKPYVMQTQLQGYLVKIVRHLTADNGFTLTQLVRAKHVLARAISEEIIRLRVQAMKRGFQGALFNMTTSPAEKALDFSFQYQPGQYPARNVYQGSYEFQKHYYPMIHDLREKKANGQDAEEFICARALDAHPRVKQWVRNIEKQERLSFWLPISTGYFYPDFVAELEDGRVLAVEYKGEHLATADDAREKRQVGEQWEKASNGRCLFLFALEDDQGRDVVKQIEDKIG